jgi:hypothetical protein
MRAAGTLMGPRQLAILSLPTCSDVADISWQGGPAVYQGRGLRRAEGKAVLTVMDFIGQRHREFRFDLRYRTLTGHGRQQLEKAVEDEYP